MEIARSIIILTGASRGIGPCLARGPHPDPGHPIKDNGCGGKLPDKTLGADVTIDVVVK